MIYLLCTNCPRYGWDQRRLWQQPRLKPDVTNWLPNESHMSHLSIIYLSYVNHLYTTVSLRIIAIYLRNARSSCIPTMIGRRHNDTVKEKYDVENEGGGRVFGPLSQR